MLRTILVISCMLTATLTLLAGPASAGAACVDVGPGDCGGYFLCYQDRLSGQWTCQRCPFANTGGCEWLVLPP